MRATVARLGGHLPVRLSTALAWAFIGRYMPPQHRSTHWVKVLVRHRVFPALQSSIPTTAMLFLDKMDRLRATLCGIQLQNPVIAASGTYGYGIEFEKVADLNSIGGIVVKGLSREPIEGNAPPRLFETEAGMINSIGLQNVGVRAFVAEKLPALRGY